MPFDFTAIDALVHAGDRAGAVARLRRAVQLHPKLQPAYSRLAELTGEAVVFEHASLLAPESAHAALLAGHALQREGYIDGAVARLEAAVRLLPAGELWSDLGATLKQAGRVAEGVAAYRRAIQLAPGYAQAYNNLGVTLQEGGDALGATQAYAAALRSAPRLSAAVPLNLLRCELETAQWAHWPLHEWLATRGGGDGSSRGEGARGRRGRRGGRGGGTPAWSIAVWGRLEARAYLTASPQLLHAAARAEARAVVAAGAAEWHCDDGGACLSPGARHAASLSAAAAAATRGGESARQSRFSLRIAILSDLDADPAAQLLRHALPLLARSPALQVTLISATPPPGSRHLRKLRAARGLRVIDVPTAAAAYASPDDGGGAGGGGGGDGAAGAAMGAGTPARALCAAQAALLAASPHVLLEVMNYLPGQQLALLARRCCAAPVHASWLRNFHGSMGAPGTVHYGVVDRVVLAPHEARQHGWSEAPVWLPHAHLVNGHMLSREHRKSRHRRRQHDGDDALGTEGLEGLEGLEGPPPACSFNRLNKLDPTIFDVWAAAMARVRRGHVLLATGGGRPAAGDGSRQAEAALRREAAARGLDVPRRLRFAPYAPSAEAHAARLARCGVALDARVWGAHTTGLDLLAAGVGLLSCRGAHFASRTGDSLLRGLGVPHLAVHGLRAYSDQLARLLDGGGGGGPPAAEHRRVAAVRRERFVTASAGERGRKSRHESRPRPVRPSAIEVTLDPLP